MTTPANKDNPVALRKQLIQMRMELNRQKIRHEALILVEPVQKIRSYQQRFSQSAHPLLLVAGVTAASFFITRKRSSATSLLALVRIASSFMPLFAKSEANQNSTEASSDQLKKRTKPY